jgi:hypothetical protein
MGLWRERDRIPALVALLVLACSSSTKTVATDSCSPGEIAQCQLASGCNARKTCNLDGRSYGPCQCVTDGGPSGGSSGSVGRGGTGGAGGRGGASGAGGVPPGGSGGVPPAGSGGMPGGSGPGGGPPIDGGGPGGTGPGGGPPMDGGGPGGTGGTAGDGGPCLRCRPAFDQGASPNDPLICGPSRSPYAQLFSCACGSGSLCTPVCGPSCVNPSGNPFPLSCQTCVFDNCAPLVSDCMNN